MTTTDSIEGMTNDVCKSSKAFHPCSTGTKCLHYEKWYQQNILPVKQKNSVFASVDAELLHALHEGFKAYAEHGARSSKKLDILHGIIAEAMIKLGRIAVGKGTGLNKEAKLTGRWYAKNVDVAGYNINTGKPTDATLIKYALSNIKQNANNYFESGLGETMNLRRAGINVHHMIFLPRIVPYFDKNGTIQKTEELNDHDIDKYRELYNDMTDPNLNSSLPNSLLIKVIDIWDIDESIRTGDKISLSTAKEANITFLSQENQDFLRKVGNFQTFLTKL